MAEELRDIEPLRPLIARSPLAIFSDIDGTLAPIVPNPEDASISPRARAAIQKLLAAGARVAFITGRALEKARQIVDVEGAYFAANHGINVYADGEVETPEEVRPYVAWAQQVIRDLADIDVPGVIVEDKGPVVAFHYRQAPSDAQAVAAIRAAISSSEAASRFRVQDGRKVIELRPPLDLDKGTAVVALAQSMGAAAVLCLGDDATDLDMFRGVQQLRAEGTPGANISVWSAEINPLVLESTDYFLRGVEGVEWLLEEVLRALPEKA
jgi:trehalose 6-phosphate phosphatase